MTLLDELPQNNDIKYGIIFEIRNGRDDSCVTRDSADSTFTKYQYLNFENLFKNS